MLHYFHTSNNSIFMSPAKIHMFFSIYINFFSLTLIFPVIPQQKCVHFLEMTLAARMKTMTSITSNSHREVPVASDRRNHSPHEEGTPNQ